MSLTDREEKLLDSIKNEGYNEVAAYVLPDGGIGIMLSHRASMDNAVELRVREADIAFLYGSQEERRTCARTNTCGPWDVNCKCVQLTGFFGGTHQAGCPKTGIPEDPEFPHHVESCVCPRFPDIAPQLIADLACPIHGVDGSSPGDIIE